MLILHSLKQTILKFSHSSYMVIILYSLKTLLSLQLLSHLTISKFYQHATWNFFGLVILLNFFGKQLEAMSNIITIISKITELVSHNIVSHSYIPISHGVNKKSPPIVSPGPLPYQVLIRFFNLQEIFYQPFFALIRLP